MDKVLSILTKVFAVVILVVVGVMVCILYGEKYMLVQGAESTIENSIYSSDDLEIAIDKIDIKNNKIGVTIKNKSNNTLEVSLRDLKINNIEYIAVYSAKVSGGETNTQEINIRKSGTGEVDKVTVIEFEFRVNNRHNIDLTINVSDVSRNE